MSLLIRWKYVANPLHICNGKFPLQISVAFAQFCSSVYLADNANNTNSDAIVGDGGVTLDQSVGVASAHEYDSIKTSFDRTCARHLL